MSKIRKPSKRQRANLEIQPKEPLEPAAACGALKKYKVTKFDQTVNVVMHLGIDPAQADQAIRGSVSLPNGIGVSKKVIAFCREDVAKLAKAAGAVEAGADDLVAKIEGGWMDFDVAVASPDMMRVVSKLGKVLGPKGLMPNPKLGTVTPNVAEAVKAAKGGQIEFRVEKAGIIHGGLGKLSFSNEALRANFDAFVDAVVKAKPSGAKGKYLRKVALSSSMGPGLKIDVAQVHGG